MNGMPAVYIDRSNLRLEYGGGTLIIRPPDGPPQALPLRQIDALLVRSNVQVEARLLAHLASQGTSILIMSGRSGERLARVTGYRHGDAARRVAQYHAWLDEKFRIQTARYILSRKLRSQHNLLVRALGIRPDLRYPLTRAMRVIRNGHGSVKTACKIASLRGIEGAAAAAYFEAYGALLPDKCNFTGRNRRPPRDPVNAALSLGYTMLMSDGVRALLLAGLDPLIGYYHELEHKRDALACDLIERHRAGIDYMVWRLFAERHITPEQFERHNGACLMTKAARKHFYAAYEAWMDSNRRRLLEDAHFLIRALPGGKLPDEPLELDSDDRDVTQ